jgi:hypothetical protein
MSRTAVRRSWRHRSSQNAEDRTGMIRSSRTAQPRRLVPINEAGRFTIAALVATLISSLVLHHQYVCATVNLDLGFGMPNRDRRRRPARRDWPGAAAAGTVFTARACGASADVAVRGYPQVGHPLCGLRGLTQPMEPRKYVLIGQHVPPGDQQSHWPLDQPERSEQTHTGVESQPVR